MSAPARSRARTRADRFPTLSNGAVSRQGPAGHALVRGRRPGGSRGQRVGADLGGAVRADRPAQPQPPLADSAPASELGAAVRADDEVLLDVTPAGRAGAAGDGLLEDLLLESQGALLGERSRGTDHQVDEGPQEGRYEREQESEDREGDRGGTPPGVPHHVVGQRHEEQCHVEDEQEDAEEDERGAGVGEKLHSEIPKRRRRVCACSSASRSWSVAFWTTLSGARSRNAVLASCARCRAICRSTSSSWRRSLSSPPPARRSSASKLPAITSWASPPSSPATTRTRTRASRMRRRSPAERDGLPPRMTTGWRVLSAALMPPSWSRARSCPTSASSSPPPSRSPARPGSPHPGRTAGQERCWRLGAGSGSRCAHSSVTKGMKGWRRRSAESRTVTAVAAAASFPCPSSPLRSRTFTISM